MKAAGFGLRGLWRELRSGDVAVLLAALVVAVGAMTAVGFFTDRVGQAVERRSSEVLAADLVLRSTRPLPEEYGERARGLGLATADGISFPSVVLLGEASALADIEAVGQGYPLRGELRVSDVPFGPAEAADGVPPAGEAWADPRLMARLDAKVGDTLEVGALRLQLTRVIDYRPDQGFSFVDLAPALLINVADVPGTGLIQPGSRASWRLLMAGEAAELRALRGALGPTLGPGERFRSVRDTRPEISGALENAESFLGLAAMISTLLGAVAVALTAHRYARRQQDNVALMKCLGVSQGFVMRSFLAQLVALALVAGVGGSALGFAAQLGLTTILGGFVGSSLPPAGLAPAGYGMLVAFVLLGGFALVPFIHLRRVPPARVLRHDLEPPPMAYLLIYGAAGAAVLALIYSQVPDPRLVGWVAAGMLGALVVLSAAGWALVRSTSVMRGRAGAAWRYGLANIARRGRDSVVQVVVFGLGLMVLLLLTVVRNDLMNDWRATLPEDAPNRFMINIQADEIDEVRTFLETNVSAPNLAPMVRARVTHIGDVSVEDYAFPAERGRRLVIREGNLSWTTELNPDNRLVEGAWWGDSGRQGEISVEKDFAVDAGIDLGDTIRFDIAGEPLEARVTSVRTVEWDSFSPNFFMLLSPGTLDGFPVQYIGSAHVPDERRGVTMDLVRQFPSITVLDMEAILNQVRSVMDQAAMAVQYVFLFSLAAGIVVLLAVVQATREERMYESAVLRTLGARRRVVLAGVAVEFTTLGGLAGVLAAGGATAVAWVLATEVFRLSFYAEPLVWVAGLAAGVMVVGLAGTLAARRVVDHPPVETLRRY